MLNVTQVQQYIPILSKEMALKAVADAPTAAMLKNAGSAQYGIKGTASILKLSDSVSFQANTGCGSRNAIGDTSLSNTTISVAKIKIVTNECADALYNTYFQYAIGQGQDPRNEGQLYPDFLRTLLSNKSALINYEVEKALWNGDTSISGTSNLKYFDGILKQTLAGSYVSLPDSGSTIVEKLQNAFLAVPVEIRTKPDFRMFIGEDTFALYTVALSLKNIFKPTQDYTLFGTTAQLAPVSGLNGSNKLVATRLSNLQLGMDGTDEVDKVIMNYSVETNFWYFDYFFACGITTIYPEQIGYAVLS